MYNLTIDGFDLFFPIVQDDLLYFLVICDSIPFVAIDKFLLVSFIGQILKLVMALLQLPTLSLFLSHNIFQLILILLHPFLNSALFLFGCNFYILPIFLQRLYFSLKEVHLLYHGVLLVG